jgi:GrpB-like predicted nucleotidyltransferase (UPF0157 family)
VLGLKHGVNLLVEYDPDWPHEFVQERARITTALVDVARDVQHYGSTAIPGLRAKPILDILVGVAPLDQWARCRLPLEALGYDYAENAGVPGHHVFGRGKDQSERTHLVHVVEFLGPEWSSNLQFRDALRADAKLRAAYVAEKERAIEAAPKSRPLYNELKHGFIARAKAALTEGPARR